MFKNFKGTVITEDQALLAMKLLKVGFETGLFQNTFEYAGFTYTIMKNEYG